MQHSLNETAFVPGTRVVVYDAWLQNPTRAVMIKKLGSMFIADTERSVRLSASLNRIWLADDLFGPINPKGN